MAKLISEYRDQSIVGTVVEESANNGKRNYYITGSFLKIGERNQNGNLYPRDVVTECVRVFNETKIKLNRGVGELNHPHSPEVDLNNIAIIIESLTIEGDDVIGKAKVTSKGPGETVRGLIDDGLSFGVSLRALGTLDEDKVMQEGMTLIAIDLVSDPSFKTSFVDPILESKEWKIDKDGNIIEDLKAPSYNIEESIKSAKPRNNEKLSAKEDANLVSSFRNLISSLS